MGTTADTSRKQTLFFGIKKACVLDGGERLVLCVYCTGVLECSMRLLLVLRLRVVVERSECSRGRVSVNTYAMCECVSVCV
jgi:hypothetical protein